MTKLQFISDYVIHRLRSENGSDLNHLKLQKLLYYCQAWHLAFYEKPLFDGKFQAWIHGPVNRDIYDRFKDTKYMYSDINVSDISGQDFEKQLSEFDKIHINSILDAYAKYSPTQLELMTHSEEPWLKAREGYEANQRCEKEIDEELMKTFYRNRLSGN